MILEYIRHRIPENGAAELEAAHARAAGLLALSSVCHDYELSRRVGQPGHYSLTDAVANRNRHTATAEPL